MTVHCRVVACRQPHAGGDARVTRALVLPHSSQLVPDEVPEHCRRVLGAGDATRRHSEATARPKGAGRLTGGGHPQQILRARPESAEFFRREMALHRHPHRIPQPQRHVAMATSSGRISHHAASRAIPTSPAHYSQRHVEQESSLRVATSPTMVIEEGRGSRCHLDAVSPVRRREPRDSAILESRGPARSGRGAS